MSIAGLYAITPDLDDTAALLGKVEAALAGGARLLQYRNKIADPALRLAQARALAGCAAATACPLIINDRSRPRAAKSMPTACTSAARTARSPRRARGSGRTGSSASPATGRSRTRSRSGASGRRLRRLRRLLSIAASRPARAGAPLRSLGEAKRRPGLPVVAIGGITVDNAPQLIAAGADSVSVITALFGAPDVRAAAQQFSALFAEPANRSRHRSLQ